MDAIRVSGIVHEKTSKSGNPYIALDIALTPSFTKTVFLDPQDIEILKLYLENESLKNKNV